MALLVCLRLIGKCIAPYLIATAVLEDSHAFRIVEYAVTCRGRGEGCLPISLSSRRTDEPYCSEQNNYRKSNSKRFHVFLLLDRTVIFLGWVRSIKRRYCQLATV